MKFNYKIIQKAILLFAVYACGCSPGNHLKKYYTTEDNTVFDLVEKIQKMQAIKNLQLCCLKLIQQH